MLEEKVPQTVLHCCFARKVADPQAKGNITDRIFLACEAIMNEIYFPQLDGKACDFFNIHAPKGLQLIDQMLEPSPKVQEILARVGKFKPKTIRSEFELLPVLGPYMMKNGSCYLGQFFEGKEHGFGVEVS